MLRVRWSVLALAGVLVYSAASAVTVQEDFSTNPLQNGWQVFGDTNLFTWNATNGNLEVTWDSSHSNSFFYFPLGIQVTRFDDFSVEFDLRLIDIASGAEPGKTGPLELGFGMLNFAGATSTNFMRGSFGAAPNLAEFTYYTSGYYDFGGGYLSAVNPTTTPSFISDGYGYDYTPRAFDAYEYELPTNQPVHVKLSYNGVSQAALLEIETNGVVVGPLPPVFLNIVTNSGFTPTDNFHVDMFSISSYSSAGDDYDSVLAHGTVDNLKVGASLRPIAQFSAGFTTDGRWEASFYTHTNWVYTLERTSDFRGWAPVSATLRGTEDFMSLQDTNAPLPTAFYRVRAE